MHVIFNKWCNEEKQYLFTTCSSTKHQWMIASPHVMFKHKPFTCAQCIVKEKEKKTVFRLCKKFRFILTQLINSIKLCSLTQLTDEDMLKWYQIDIWCTLKNPESLTPVNIDSSKLVLHIDTAMSSMQNQVRVHKLSNLIILLKTTAGQHNVKTYKTFANGQTTHY